ncbi:hypothetical protein [Microbulbifer sp. DLAB2-AA]|uniref:hypothetical protein n=1 Tax=Microbulbifer sp. DLAB2-AA TaxID=3243394 RepID=UPI00403A4FAC
MSLTDVQTWLDNNKGGSINLDLMTLNNTQTSHPILTPPTELNQWLHDAFNVSNGLFVDLPQAINVVKTSEAVTLTGAQITVTSLSINRSPAKLVFTQNETILELIILLEPAPWKLSDSFQYMQGYPFNVLTFTTPSLVFSSWTNKTAFKWNAEHIFLECGLNFAASLACPEVLTYLRPFFKESLGSGLVCYGVLTLTTFYSQTNNTLLPELNIKAKLKVPPHLFFFSVKEPYLGVEITNVVYGPQPKDYIQTPPVLYFGMKLTVGNHTLDFKTQILDKFHQFNFGITSEPSDPLSLEDIFNLMAGQSWSRVIPAELQQFLGNIDFQSFMASINLGATPSIGYLSTTVGSNPEKQWKIFDEFTIDSFDVNWRIHGPIKKKHNRMLVRFETTFDFFPDIFPGKFDVVITSDLTIAGSFVAASGQSVSFDNLVEHITSGLIKIPSQNFDIAFTEFELLMNTRQKHYALSAEGNAHLDIMGNSVIKLQQVSVSLQVSYPVIGQGAKSYSGSIRGMLYISTFGMVVSAVYDGSSETWQFSTQTLQPISIKALIDHFFTGGYSLPDFLKPDLIFKHIGIDATVPSGSQKASYSVTTIIDWRFNLFGHSGGRDTELDIEASLNLKYNGNLPSGQELSGAISANATLPYIKAPVTLSYSFSQGNEDLSVTWEGFTASYDNGLVTFQISQWSFGSIIVALMKTVGYPNFQLDQPWDLLNEISLNGFQLSLNLNTKAITVHYTLPSPISTPFVTINGFSLTRNQHKKVLLAIDGSSLAISQSGGSEGEKGKNLFGKGQDVTDLPTVPGKGNQLFDLQYLGLGQRVALTGVPSIDSVGEATTYLKQAFTAPTGPNHVPISGTPQQHQLRFDANSDWLIGTQFKAMDTVAMSVIFNDPNLYGLLIELSGKRAKSLAGLKFEILYKKVTDTIGLYQIELTLPQAIRQLQFGAVSITLPVIDISIYTNGNFKVNVGFPASLTNFSRSFTLQAFPFTGSGGFYFAVLDGQTSKQVPVTSKGTFDPVITFGIAVQLGLGKSVNKGILKAGLSVTVVGMVEGVIGFYNPNPGNPGQGEHCYQLQGTVAIVGKLYGEVSFAIINASVNVTVYASARITLESYKAIPIALDAGVRVSLTVGVDLGLFTIHIHLSFSTHISETFTIGHDRVSQAPWYDSAYHGVSALEARPHLLEALDEMARPPMSLTPLVFQPLSVASKAPLRVYFMPHLTVASEKGSHARVPQYVGMLYIDLASYETLAKQVLPWVISSLTGQHHQALNQVVSLAELQQLAHTLNNMSTTPITYHDIASFLAEAFTISILAPPQGQAKKIQASVFPMPPALSLIRQGPDSYVSPTGPTGCTGSTGATGAGPTGMPGPTGSTAPGPIYSRVDFDCYSLCAKAYQQDIRNYFNALSVNYQNTLEGQNSHQPPHEHLVLNSMGDISLAEFIFQDYFALMAKSSVQDALTSLKRYQYTVGASGPKSVSGIVAKFNAYGTTGPSGSTGNTVSAALLASHNKTAVFDAQAVVSIAGCTAAQPGTQSLKSIGECFKVEVPLLAQVNELLPGIITAGTTLSGPTGGTGATGPTTYTVQQNDTLVDIAHALSSQARPYTVAELATAVQAQEILNEQALTVPYLKYQIKDKDTFRSITQHFGLTGPTGFASLSGLAQTNAYIQGLVKTGTIVPLSATGPTGATGHCVTSADTLLTIAAATGKSVADVADSLQDRAVLADLMPLTIPPFTLSGGTGASFQSLTNRYGISAEQLTYSNADVELFTAGQQLTIPGLEYLPVSHLMDSLVAADAFKNQAGLAARYLLHGLRLPITENIHVGASGATGLGPLAGEDTGGLYQLSGQQFSLTGATAGDKLILQNTQAVPWLTLGDKGGIGPTGSLYIQLEQANIDRIQQVQQASLNLDQSATPMDIVQSAPQQFSFSRAIPWQYPGQIALTYGGDEHGHNNRQPVIWPFPDALMSLLQAPAEGLGQAQLCLKTMTHESPTAPVEQGTIASYAWASFLSVKLQQLPRQAAQHSATLPYTYDLVGADDVSIVLLERLLRYSNANPDSIDQIHVLYGPSETGKAPVGLQSQTTENSRTLLLQANLSTATRPAIYASTLDSVALMADRNIINTHEDFVKCLWEGSIVRSGGYYFYYYDTSSKHGLPETLFNQDSSAEISLVITYKKPVAEAGIPDFINSVIIGDHINRSTTTVYAEATNRETSVATVPPGNIGFQLHRPNVSSSPTGATAALGPEQYLQQQFNLLSYTVEEAGGFTGSHAGLPVGPCSTGPTAGPTASWHYDQVVPVFKYAQTGPTGSSGPNAAHNPYQGVGATAAIGLRWLDMFGNTINTDTGAPGSLSEGLRYSDPLVSLAQCPSLNSEYSVGSTGGTGYVDVTFSFSPQRYQLGPTGSTGSHGATALGVTAYRNNAAIDAETYTKLSYQLMSLTDEGGAGLYLTSSLDEYQPHAIEKDTLLGPINSVYQYLQNIIAGVTASPPADFVISHPVVLSNPDSIFPLDVDLTMARDPALVHRGLSSTGGVAKVVTPIKPMMKVDSLGATGATGPVSLKGFARDFEAAYQIPDTTLFKIATGIDRNDVDAESSNKKVWVVRLGRGGICYAVQKADQVAPYFYAPRPLATSLLSVKGHIYRYIASTGLDIAHPEQKSFSDIDLDTWGQQCLVAIDDVLAPEYAIPMGIISMGGTGATGATGPNVFQRIVDSKKTLASAIAQDISPIISGCQPEPSALEQAQEKLKQELLIKLSAAYDIDAIVQHTVATTGPAGSADTDPPQLYGKPLVVQPSGASGGAGNMLPHASYRLELPAGRQAAMRAAMLGATGATGEAAHVSAYSLSTAKVPLGHQQSYLTYLFNTKQAAEHKSMHLTLDYQVSHIEHQISKTAMDGYKASSWLSFVLPLAQGASSEMIQSHIGQVEIPIPLRAYPIPPSIIRQAGLPSGATGATGAALLYDMRKWSYDYTYQDVSAAQDSIDTQILFNVSGSSGPSFCDMYQNEPPLDLALAQFISAYSEIKHAFVTNLTQVNTNTSATDAAYKQASTALEAFAYLISRVANAWGGWREYNPGGATGPFGSTGCSYRISEPEPKSGAAGNLKVTVKSLTESDYTTPTVEIPGSGYHPVATTGPTGSNAYYYKNSQNKYLSWEDRNLYPQRTVRLAGLDIFRQQNAWAGASIIRNLNLLSHSQSLTNTDFIYQTPLVKYVNPLTPLLNNADLINIALLSPGHEPPQPLTFYLRALFQVIFNGLPDGSNQTILVECAYQYNLQNNFALEQVTLPISLSFPLSFKIPDDWDIGSTTYCSDQQSFVCELCKTISEWIHQHGMVRNENIYDGQLRFAISFYAKGKDKQPLLKVEDLFLKIKDIKLS